MTDETTDGSGGLPSDIIEATDRALADLFKGDDPANLVVGGSDESEEEMVARFELEQAREGEEANTSSADRRIRTLEEELASTREMVRKLAENQGGVNVEKIARGVTEEEEDRKWEATYKKIKANGGYCTILMHASDDPGKNSAIPVGVNGHVVYLPRNQPVKVHVSILEVLVRSRVNSSGPFVNERGERDWQAIRYQCYPFSLLDNGVQLKDRRRGALMAA